jgi:hypothetical protein
MFLIWRHVAVDPEACGKISSGQWCKHDAAYKKMASWSIFLCVFTRFNSLSCQLPHFICFAPALYLGWANLMKQMTG